MQDIKTYQEFWPYYLREHSQPATRRWHYVGTSCAIGLLIYAIISEYYAVLILAVISGYFFAWVSHGMIERNKPATFKHPLWSLYSDFRMYFYFITGRLGPELKRAGVQT